MPKYLVTYDLRKQRNYAGLIKVLRDWKAISPLESVWFATLTGPAGTITNLLRAQMDADDGLLVVELKPGADWATANVNENGAAWLQSNVTA